MITRTFGIRTAMYSYDPLDRLTQVVSGTTTVTLTHNGDGVRVGKHVNGTSTDYVQDVGGSLPVAVAETSGGQTSRFVYGNDLVARIDPAANPTFYHHDGLGSVRALSNLAGQRTDAYSYDVFGSPRSHTGDADQTFTFTGEQADDDLGFVYLRARYYDPILGQFLSRDPLPGAPRRTQSRNRYTYCGNCPTACVDPSGQIAPWDVLSWVQSILDILADHSDPESTALGVAELGTDVGSDIATETGHGVIGTAGKLAGAGLSGYSAGQELNRINRVPSESELRQRVATEYGVSPDDPTVDIMIQSGIAQEEWRTATAGRRVLSSVNTTFESIPLFGTGYKVWTMPDKVERIFNNLFRSNRSTPEPVDNTGLRYYSGGGAWRDIGSPPSGGK
jgi:RHS repeat-associated protein